MNACKSRALPWAALYCAVGARRCERLMTMSRDSFWDKMVTEGSVSVARLVPGGFRDAGVGPIEIAIEIGFFEV